MIIALATNCNPGTSYTTSMPFCVATAVLQMGLTVPRPSGPPPEAPPGRDPNTDVPGSLFVGGRADLHVLNAPSISHPAYRPGVLLATAVYRHGVRAVTPRPARVEK